MSLCESDSNKSSISAKEIYSGALPTAKGSGWKMQRNMPMCLTLLTQGM